MCGPVLQRVFLLLPLLGGISWFACQVSLVDNVSRLAPEGPRLEPEIRAWLQREAGERAGNRAHFPGDHWSQDDDFHNSEAAWMREVSGRNHVPLEQVILALDQVLHRRYPNPDRQTYARPCKPRPFYD